MNEVERRWCDFTSWSAVQCLSYHAKNIGLLNRRMACHAYVGYPFIPPPLVAVDGLCSVPPRADGLACVHLALRGQGHRIATAIGNKEMLEQGTLSLPGQLI